MTKEWGEKEMRRMKMKRILSGNCNLDKMNERCLFFRVSWTSTLFPRPVTPRAKYFTSRWREITTGTSRKLPRAKPETVSIVWNVDEIGEHVSFSVLQQQFSSTHFLLFFLLIKNEKVVIKVVKQIVCKNKKKVIKKLWRKLLVEEK